MRITRIYYQGKIREGRPLTLPAGASHHLIRVLRCRKNSPVTVFNGEGGEYSALLVSEDPRAAQLDILGYADIDRESPLKIIVLQGISRSEHMDATVQKATELGAGTIVPVICQRSVAVNRDRMRKKLERWHQIAISACEQSGRNRLPTVSAIERFDQAVNGTVASCKLVLDPAAAHTLNTIEPPAGPIAILCGPEGGLSDDEMNTACRAGYKRILFGPRTLRTETAGPAFVSALQVLWGDMG